MQLFALRSSACRPIQGGIFQRQGAIKSIRYELNDFIQEFGDSMKSQWLVLLMELSVIEKNMPSFVIVDQYRLKRGSRRWRNSWPCTRNQWVILAWWPWSLIGCGKEINADFFGHGRRWKLAEWTITSSPLNRSMRRGPGWKYITYRISISSAITYLAS